MRLLITALQSMDWNIIIGSSSLLARSRHTSLPVWELMENMLLSDVLLSRAPDQFLLRLEVKRIGWL